MEDGSQNYEKNLNSGDIINSVIEMYDEQHHPPHPYVVIHEQPELLLRYRYKSEKLRAAIGGINGNYPAIKVVGFKGEAVVLVSCVTRDLPYRSHPHCLTGDHCKMGIFQKRVSFDSNTVISFRLNLLSTLVKDMDDVLLQRKGLKIDPFSNGFDHRSDKHLIDLDAVRLCFQVYIEGNRPGTFDRCLPPIVSEPIKNKNDGLLWGHLNLNMLESIFTFAEIYSSLTIFKLSHASAPVSGGQQTMLFCDTVDRDDIDVVFVEESGNWTANARFRRTDVHRGCGISFLTPKYKKCQIDQPVNVSVYLRRRSDGVHGKAVPFMLCPEDSYQQRLKRKREIYGTAPSFSNSPPMSSNVVQPPGYALAGPSSEQQQHVVCELPIAVGQACHVQGSELDAGDRTNITSVRRSLSDVACSAENLVPSKVRSSSLVEEPSLVILQQPSHLPCYFRQHEMGSPEMLSTIPPAGTQQVFARMDHDQRLASIIAELNNCTQPPISSNQLVPQPSNIVNQSGQQTATGLDPQAGVSCPQLSHSPELQSPNEGIGNLSDRLSGLIFTEFDLTEMQTSQENLL